LDEYQPEVVLLGEKNRNDFEEMRLSIDFVYLEHNP